MVVPQGVVQFRQALVRTLEAEQTQRTPRGQELFHKLFEACGRLDKAVASYQEKLEALAHMHPVCQRLSVLCILSYASTEAFVYGNSR